MKIIQYIFLFLLGITFFSCETPIDFEGSKPDPLLVLNSLISPDSAVTVHLSKSKFFLDSNNQSTIIGDATVKLYVNGALKENLQYSGDGIYKAIYKPRLGDQIKITASKSPFKDVSAESSIVPHTKISGFDSVSVVTDSLYIIDNKYDDATKETKADTTGINYNKDLNLKINFKDSALMKNYYRLCVFYRYYYSDGMVTTEQASFKSNDEVFTGRTTGFVEKESGYFEFSDELISGKAHSLAVSVAYSTAVDYSGHSSGTSKGGFMSSIVKKQLLVDVQSISESLYLYLRSREAQDNYSDFFSEPVQIHSNIENGIGILGSATSNFVLIDLPLGYNYRQYISE